MLKYFTTTYSIINEIILFFAKRYAVLIVCEQLNVIYTNNFVICHDDYS